MYISAADRNNRLAAQRAKDMFSAFIMDNLTSSDARYALVDLLDSNAIDWFAAYDVLRKHFPDMEESSGDVTIEDLAQFLNDPASRCFYECDDFIGWWERERRWYSEFNFNNFGDVEALLEVYFDEEKHDEWFKETAHDLTIKFFRDRAM